MMMVLLLLLLQHPSSGSVMMVKEVTACCLVKGISGDRKRWGEIMHMTVGKIPQHKIPSITTHQFSGLSLARIR